MRVSIRCFVVAIILLAAPFSASAAPITVGVWSPVGTPTEAGGNFWDNASVDCDCNAGQALLALGYGNLEFLHDGNFDPVAFGFQQSILGWTPLFSKTTLTNGTPGQFQFAVTYDTNPGRGNSFGSNSLNQPGQFALFRQVNDDMIRYFIGFEDINVRSRKSDRDYNDLIMTFTQIASVPEPSTIALLGAGLAGAGLRRLRRRRIHG